MSKHTPGPWINYEEIGATYSPDGTPIMTAGMGCVSDFAEEGRANARLIAAAPDLLAACQRALPRLELALSIRNKLIGRSDGGIAADIAVIKAAIAKVEGGGS